MENNNYAIVFKREEYDEDYGYPLVLVNCVLGSERTFEDDSKVFIIDKNFKQKFCNMHKNHPLSDYLLTHDELPYAEDKNSLDSEFVYGSPFSKMFLNSIISFNTEGLKDKNLNIVSLQGLYLKALSNYNFYQLYISEDLTTYVERKEPLKNVVYIESMIEPIINEELGLELPDEDYDVFKALPTHINIKEMYQKCKKYIIAQDEHILPILGGINDNLMAEIPEEKTNILVCGPTGVGKTALFKKIAELAGIPIVIENSTQFTKVGYVGRNIDDIFEDLLQAANNDLELAQRGIIIIDEIDKKASGKDDSVSGVGVLQSMLKLLEGGEYTYEVGKGGFSTLKTFNTLKTTIAFGGAFSGLKDQLNKKTIGFDKSEISKPSSIDIYSVENLEKYGIPPEFVGRLQLIEMFNSLSVEDLKRILLEAAINPYSLFIKKMKRYNTIVKNDESFINAVAEEAYRRKSGARALYSTIKDATKIAESEIMLMPNYQKELILTPECVVDNKAYTLKKIYKKHNQWASQY